MHPILDIVLNFITCEQSNSYFQHNIPENFIKKLFPFSWNVTLAEDCYSKRNGTLHQKQFELQEQKSFY